MLTRYLLTSGLSTFILLGIGGGCLDLQTTGPNGGGGQTPTDTSSSSGSGANGANGGTGASGASGGSGANGGSGGSGSSKAVVNCNGIACAPGEVCCLDWQTPAASTCDVPGTCLPDELQIPCDGPSDCPNDGICCAVIAGGTDYKSVSCTSTCDGSDMAVLCAGDESVCPAGTMCKSSLFLGDGYFVCK